MIVVQESAVNPEVQDDMENFPILSFMTCFHNYNGKLEMNTNDSELLACVQCKSHKLWG